MTGTKKCLSDGASPRTVGLDQPGVETKDGVSEIVQGWRRARPELDTSAMEVFGRLHRSYLLYQTKIGEGFDRFNINAAAFDVLACLRRAEPDYRRMAGELAKQTLVTSGGLSLRVDRLEELGLVVRERNQDDARVVFVRLTEEGKRLIDETAEAHFAMLRNMLACLDDDEKKDLAKLLARLEEGLRQFEAGA